MSLNVTFIAWEHELLITDLQPVLTRNVWSFQVSLQTAATYCKCPTQTAVAVALLVVCCQSSMLKSSSGLPCWAVSVFLLRLWSCPPSPCSTMHPPVSRESRVQSPVLLLGKTGKSAQRVGCHSSNTSSASARPLKLTKVSNLLNTSLCLQNRVSYPSCSHFQGFLSVSVYN